MYAYIFNFEILTIDTTGSYRNNANQNFSNSNLNALIQLQVLF